MIKLTKLTMLFEDKKQTEDKVEVEVRETEAWVNPEAIEAVVKLSSGNSHVQLRGASLIVKESASEIAEVAKKNEKAKPKKSG